MGNRKGSLYRWSLTVMTFVLCLVLFGGISSSFAASTISGHVYISDGATPISDLHVFATDYDTNQWLGGTNTDGLGAYEITGLPAGRYRIRACASCSHLLYLDVFYPDDWDYGAVEAFVIGEGEQIGNINFLLSEAYAISGRITNTSGQGLQVDVVPSLTKCRNFGIAGVGTNADGEYFLTVPPGTQVYLQACATCRGLNYVDEFWNDADGIHDCNSAIPFVADSQHSTGIDFHLDSGDSISGKITQMDGTTGIGNLHVYVENYQTGEWKGGIDTGPDGSYSITGLPPGDYRVRACASCRGLPYADESFNDAYNHHEAQPVTIIAGQQTTGIDFSLIGGITVSGRVTDSQNQPIAGMHVHAYAGKCWQKWIGGADTDGDGNYVFVIPAIGEAYIRTCPECKGMLQISEWWNAAAGTVDCNAAVAIPANEGQNQSGINFSLDLGASISGTIKDSSGNPIVGIPINVTVFTGDPCGQNQGIVGTNSNPLDGTYTIFGIPAGTGYLRTWNNNTNYVNEWWNGTGSSSECEQAQVGTVAAGDVLSGMDFYLDLGGTISGKVTQVDGLTGIGNLHVFVQDYNSGQWMGGVNTDPNGNYAINGLPAGDYRVSACGSCNGMPYANAFYKDTFLYHEADPVLVTPGLTTSGIDFSLSPAVPVTGRVTDAQNQPIAGMHVHVFPGKCRPDAIVGTNTDNDGYYTLFMPPVGQAYIRTCSECVQMNYVSEWWNDAAGTLDCNEAVPISVNPGQPQTGINFSLEPGASISGTVRDGSGNPITGKSIGLTVFTGNPCGSNQVGSGNVSNPSDGTYTIWGIPAGSYYLRSSNNGDANVTNEWWSAAGSSLGCENAQVITLGPGDVVTGKDLHLDPGGWVTGRVTEMDGVTGISNLHVSVNNQIGVWIAGSDTDQDGYYSIPGIPAGAWRVMACASCRGLSYMNEYYDNTPDFNLARLVSVVVGQTTGGIDFSLGLDSDNDTLPDEWEMRYFGNLSQTPSGDPDGDGLNNQQEVSHATNPTLIDSDGDKISDRYEVNAGTNPNDPGSTPGLPVFGYVTNIHQPDGGFQTLIDLQVGFNDFIGNPEQDIVSIFIQGPEGLNLSLNDLTYNPQFKDFYTYLPGSPAPGEYIFNATTAGSLSGTDRDYQHVIKTLPIPDKATFKPLDGETISSKTPSFSWGPVEFPEFPLAYFMEIWEADTRVFYAAHRLDMTYCTVPAGVLQPGHTYRWRVRVVDDSNAKLLENRANSEWLTFSMADVLVHEAPPALDLTWGANTWSFSGGSGLAIDVAVVDHDGVAYNGSSHQVKMRMPNGTEYPVPFGSSVSPIKAYYSYYINSVASGEYTFTITDLEGNTSSAVDTLNVVMLSPPDEDSLSPSLKTEHVTAFFDNIYVDGAPYENFESYSSIGELDPGKWMSPSGASLEVQDENHKLKFSVSNTVGRGHAGVSFANGSAISSTEAEITIDSTSSGNCMARIYWGSNYSGLPYIDVSIRVYQNEVRYEASQLFNRFGTLTWETLANEKLIDISPGQKVTVSILWDEVTKTLTFSAANGTLRNNATYAFLQGPYPEFTYKQLHTRIHLTTDTTPTFTWDPVPGAKWYRVRIYNWNNTRTIWSGDTGEISYTMPPGVLKPDAFYKYQLAAFDSPMDFPQNNGSLAPSSRSNSYIFYTESVEDPNPFIDLDSHGAMAWNDDENGPHLGFRIKVYDAQGVPDNISTVTVRLPGGTTIPLDYDEDNFYQANTPTRGVYYLDLLSQLPDYGTYLFTVTDRDGNQYTVEEELTSNSIGYPARSSLSATVPGKGRAVDFDWADVPEVVSGQGFYQLEIYNDRLNRVHTFLTTESEYHLLEGFLKEGETYRWRITTRREFFDQNVDNGSRSPASYDDMPVIRFRGLKGDINGDGNVDLLDAVLALKAMSGFPTVVNLETDVNEDGKIGIAEVGYILQVVAGNRSTE